MAIIGNNAAPQAASQQRTPASRPPQQQTKAKTSLFNGNFKNAQPPGLNGNFLSFQDDGSAALYDVKINRVKLLAENENDANAQPEVYSGVSWKKRETMIVEGEVVNSTCSRCPPGYQFSWVTVDGKFDYFQKDVKGFLCATFNATDPSQVDEDDISATVGPGQAAAGRLVHVAVKNKPREGGGDFAQHLWSDYEAPLAQASA